MQRDPAGYADGLGLHEYCQSAAVSSRDPMGLDNYRVAPRIIRYEQAKPTDVPEGKTKGDVDRERVEAAIDARNQKYPDGHPDHISDEERTDILSRIGKPGSKPGTFANATTIRCTDVHRVRQADGRVVYVPFWAKRPIVVVPDDRSQDLHERGHVEITQDVIDEVTERQEREGKDVSGQDREARTPERDAVRKEFMDEVSTRQDGYDAETGQGTDEQAQRAWHRRRR